MNKTIIVVDDEPNQSEDNGLTLISFQTYLAEYPKKEQSKLRIINLCNTSRYLSRGYYCSLLAEARGHTVIPSVKTVNEMRGSVMLIPDASLCTQNERSFLKNWPAENSIYIYGGETETKELEKMCKQIFRKYSTPIIKVSKSGELLNIERLSFDELEDQEQKDFMMKLTSYQFSMLKHQKGDKKYRWEMGILVNPTEPLPPSNRQAINYFVKAAAKYGIKADLITPDDALNLRQYDALFIRETTSINHHTYKIVSEAEKQGLVVIDDSTSILRCCNKVFLHDAFTYNNVPGLRTKIISSHSDEVLDEIEAEFSYPLVLKKPESSFSQGVYKVKDRDMLREILSNSFQESALALVQEYMYTEFDWRIGVLNGRAIYACRYYMARNHWQIYNHESHKNVTGDFDCLPTFEVPKNVLNAALRACKIIGNGLYGVDIKANNKNAYVIEVNDNPNLDHGVEDKYLGQELYMQIMAEFFNRLESRGK